MEPLTSDMMTVPWDMKPQPAEEMQVPQQIRGQMPLFKIKPDGTFVLPEAS